MKFNGSAKVILIVLFVSVINGTLQASSEVPAAGIVKHHQLWNGFVDKLYRLHRKRLRDHDYYTFEKSGGYGGATNNLEYYRQVDYFDRKDRQLLSSIKWENVYPFGIHMIDMPAFDQNGRLIREYSATYLPSRRTSPFETLITLHYYKDSLHSFREFDASNIRLYEQCQDTNSGRVIFALNYEDIPESLSALDQAQREAYQACFAHTESSAEPYTDPSKDPLLKQ